MVRKRKGRVRGDEARTYARSLRGHLYRDRHRNTAVVTAFFMRVLSMSGRYRDQERKTTRDGRHKQAKGLKTSTSQPIKTLGEAERSSNQTSRRQEVK